MPDIRIKDLTTTASSTASDDFFAADGTTNGTRKLSAFSPTFGGNATVGGTLTVTGDTSTFGINSSTNNSIKIITGVGTTASPRYGLLDFRNYNDLKSGAYLRVANRESDTNAFLMNIAVRSNADVLTSIATFSDTQLAVLSTTASTSTSSGALVVGNGTSGGLGVGGAATIGGLVKGAQNTYSDTNVPTGLSAGFQVDVQNATTRDILTFGDGTRHGLIRGYHDGAGTINWRFGRYTASTFAEYVRIAGLAAADAVVSIFGTTASTSTSSGALVVSGGVGVAGAIYAGGVTNATGGVRIENSGGSNVRSVYRNNYGATDEKAWVWDVDNEGSLFLRALTDAETGSTTIISFPRLGAGAGVSSVSFNANVNHTFAGAVVANRASNAFRITTAQTPASATATGTAGTICWDTSYIYVCTATNTWKRVAISTW